MNKRHRKKAEKKQQAELERALRVLGGDAPTESRRSRLTTRERRFLERSVLATVTHGDVMHKVTLDTNCLIDLEEGNERATALRHLIARHENKRIELRIPAIAASERQQGGTYFQNFSEFTARLDRLGLNGIPILPPMLYLGVAFFGQALLAGGPMIDLERQIHEILHPEMVFDYIGYCARRGIDPNANPLDRKWLNAKCDVQIVWSHIYHGGGTLVTNDENFLKSTKLSRLIGLGAGAIVRTAGASAHLDRVLEGT